MEKIRALRRVERGADILCQGIVSFQPFKGFWLGALNREMAVWKSKVISRMDLLDGRLAKQYAAMPLGYYKEVTFPYFAELLDLMGSDVRILDIGAGCGHFAERYFTSRPQSKVQFVLIDSSATLLDIAEDKLRKLGVEIDAYQLSYNSEGWERHIGRFDAIISHNSLFHLDLDRVSGFYAICFDLLRDDGLLLNQQSFSVELLKTRFKSFYQVLGPQRFLSMSERDQIVESEHLSNQLQNSEAAAMATEIADLQAKGWVLESKIEFSSLSLTVEEHLEFLRHVGFSAACVWRMMHFGMIAGLKGQALA